MLLWACYLVLLGLGYEHQCPLNMQLPGLVALLSFCWIGKCWPTHTVDGITDVGPAAARDSAIKKCLLAGSVTEPALHVPVLVAMRAYNHWFAPAVNSLPVMQRRTSARHTLTLNPITCAAQVLANTVNGTTYAGLRARTTGAPQNHWFGPAGDPRAAGIGTPEAIRLVWSCHREIISDVGPVPRGAALATT